MFSKISRDVYITNFRWEAPTDLEVNSMHKILSYSHQTYQFVADTIADLDRITAKGNPWAAIGNTCYVIQDGLTYIVDSDHTWHPIGTGTGGNTPTPTEGAVRYDVEQNLTTTQQSTAQSNIGIGGATEETTGLVKGGKTTDIMEDGSIEVVEMSISSLTQKEGEEVIFHAGGAADYGDQ